MATEKEARKDVQTIVNEKIIEQLEKGIVPWRRPWVGGIPYNLMTGKAYRNINLLLLTGLGYESNYFLREKQLKEIDASIRAGERPHIVPYWSYTDKDGNQQAPVFRYYQVYNAAQCVLPQEVIVPEPTHNLVTGEYVLQHMPHRPAVSHKEPMPYYDVLKDYVNMPKDKAFNSETEYYTAFFHELVHSTGHHTRLDRMGLVQMTEYGYGGCSQEEVVTDIATCYLGTITGNTIEIISSPEYIQSCSERIKKDKYFILTASNLAQKAIDFMLNVDADAEEVEQVDEMAAA